MILNKTRVHEYLQKKSGRKKLYNYLANSAVTMVVDKSKNKAEIEDFNQYLVNKLEGKLPLNVPLNISHEDSKVSSGLQAVDLFCWGVYRKYEHGDIQWYQQFESKIVFETEHIGE